MPRRFAGVRWSQAIVWATVLTLSSVGASAATLGQGTTELTASGSYTRSSTDFNDQDVGSMTRASAAFGFAYAVSDHWMAGFTTNITHESAEPKGSASISQSSFGLRGDLTRNFDAGENAVGYLQLSTGFDRMSFTGSDETNLLLPRLTAGLRFLVGDHASANLFAGYQRLQREDFDQNDLLAGFGFSIFPGGVR